MVNYKLFTIFSEPTRRLIRVTGPQQTGEPVHHTEQVHFDGPVFALPGVEELSPEQSKAEVSFIDPFLPTVPTFAVRETDVSRTANVGTVGMNGLTRVLDVCRI